MRDPGNEVGIEILMVSSCYSSRLIDHLSDMQTLPTYIGELLCNKYLFERCICSLINAFVLNVEFFERLWMAHKPVQRHSGVNKPACTPIYHRKKDNMLFFYMYCHSVLQCLVIKWFITEHKYKVKTKVWMMMQHYH